MHVNQVRITYDNFFYIIFKFTGAHCACKIVKGISSLMFFLFRVVYNLVVKINEIVFFDLLIERIIK